MRMVCDIYAKINCDSFPTPNWSDNSSNVCSADGQEIYDFLMSDCQNAFPQENDLSSLYHFPKENEEWELQHCVGGDKYQLIDCGFGGNKVAERCVYKHNEKELYLWFSKEKKRTVLSNQNPITGMSGDILFVFNETIEPGDHRLIGDKVIWYLCCCEKHGNITLGDKNWNWAWGESSSDIVKEFVIELRNLKMISDKQYQGLMAECEFAKNTFVLHYDITNWLRHKKYGIPYLVDKHAKQNSMAFHADVNDTLEKKGWKIFTPNVNM